MVYWLLLRVPMPNGEQSCQNGTHKEHHEAPYAQNGDPRGTDLKHDWTMAPIMLQSATQRGPNGDQNGHQSCPNGHQSCSNGPQCVQKGTKNATNRDHHGKPALGNLINIESGTMHHFQHTVWQSQQTHGFQGLASGLVLAHKVSSDKVPLKSTELWQ